MLKPFAADIAYLQLVVVSSDKPTELMDVQKIKEEGVYYTYFIYEAVKSKRQLQTSQQVRLALRNDISHLTINGTIVYSNTFGQLNAEQRPFLNFYPVMMLIYLLMLCFWGWHMNE